MIAGWSAVQPWGRVVFASSSVEDHHAAERIEVKADWPAQVLLHLVQDLARFFDGQSPS